MRIIGATTTSSSPVAKIHRRTQINPDDKGSCKMGRMRKEGINQNLDQDVSNSYQGIIFAEKIRDYTLMSVCLSARRSKRKTSKRANERTN